uniref:NR LBD domain-containing protein n=1 Tax=Steinernema glaseri TaxID=37863 RepID=A0A1I7Y734_9BILA
MPAAPLSLLPSVFVIVCDPEFICVLSHVERNIRGSRLEEAVRRTQKKRRRQRSPPPAPSYRRPIDSAVSTSELVFAAAESWPRTSPPSATSAPTAPPASTTAPSPATAAKDSSEGVSASRTSTPAASTTPAVSTRCAAVPESPLSIRGHVPPPGTGADHKDPNHGVGATRSDLGDHSEIDGDVFGAEPKIGEERLEPIGELHGVGIRIVVGCLFTMALWVSTAIQNERDSIGKRRKTDYEEESAQFIQQLVQAESLCQQLRGSVIKRTEQVSAIYDRGKIKVEYGDRLATLNDVGKSFHQQLVLLVEWAKSLPQFTSLPLEDQVALLKANSALLIVLGVAFRSLTIAEEAICLSNDTLITQQHAVAIGDINSVVIRILDELVRPMRSLVIETNEYVALKAIVFFNPGFPVSGNGNAIPHSPDPYLSHLVLTLMSSASSRELVARGPLEETRAMALRALRFHSGDTEDCRLGLLLLLLPPLQAIAQQLVEDVQLARVFGFVNIDALMEQLILNDQSSSSAAKSGDPILTQLSTPFPV